MASPAPPPTARLRPSQAASSASSSSFPTSICGLGSLGDASRVSTVSFRRRPPASPLVRCSQDPGKVERLLFVSFTRFLIVRCCAGSLWIWLDWEECSRQLYYRIFCVNYRKAKCGSFVTHRVMPVAKIDAGRSFQAHVVSVNVAHRQRCGKGLFCRNGSMGWSCWTGLVSNFLYIRNDSGSISMQASFSYSAFERGTTCQKKKELVHNKGKKSSRQENLQAKLGLDVKPQ